MLTSFTPHPVVPTGPQRGPVARLWHQLGPGSRRRHERARVDARRLAALRADWAIACHHAGLGLAIDTTSGDTVSVPRIVAADFGPPVSFVVLLRPGQPAADLVAAEPRLARALGVAGLLMTGHIPGWVTVVVVDHDVSPPLGDDGSRSDEPHTPDRVFV